MKKPFPTPVVAALTAALAFIALPNATEAGDRGSGHRSSGHGYSSHGHSGHGYSSPWQPSSRLLESWQLRIQELRFQELRTQQLRTQQLRTQQLRFPRQLRLPQLRRIELPRLQPKLQPRTELQLRFRLQPRRLRLPVIRASVRKRQARQQNPDAPAAPIREDRLRAPCVPGGRERPRVNRLQHRGSPRSRRSKGAQLARRGPGECGGPPCPSPPAYFSKWAITASTGVASPS